MAQGLSEEKIGRLAAYRDEASFTARERIALEYAELMALDHAAIGMTSSRACGGNSVTRRSWNSRWLLASTLALACSYTSWTWCDRCVTSKQVGEGVWCAVKQRLWQGTSR